jgi:hypothetical protein
MLSSEAGHEVLQKTGGEIHYRTSFIIGKDEFHKTSIKAGRISRPFI